MEKAITFTQEQKSLIWKRFVEPQNGTVEEAEQFITICENFGLNPILNDIVFQKYGDRVNFITTRDGLLRVASKQEGYVGAPNANVVREGDVFKFKPNEGEVHHEFGPKRGKILGAYAVMKHKKHNPVAVFVDFEEYFKANSSVENSRSGKPNTWDKMPSAMIQKVAEVFVLRRQFPLGGLYTQEEMELEEKDLKTPEQSDGKQPSPETVQPTQNPDASSTQQTKESTQQNSELISQEQINDLNTIINEIAKTRNVETTAITNALGKPINELDVNEFDSVKAQLQKWLEVAKESANQKQEENQTQSQEVPENNIFTIENIEEGQAPNGTQFIKVYTKEHEQPLFSRTAEIIEKIKTLNVGDSFSGNIQEENQFLFLVGVEMIKKSA